MIPIRWTQAAWLLAVVVTGCVQTPALRPVPERLPPPVHQYIQTSDPQEATVLLMELMEYPVSELLEALKAPRDYPEAPTGVLPGQTLQVRGEEFHYGLYVPEDYDSRKAYPLIVCLHGAGFNGDAYLDRWKPRLEGRYLLVCPSIDFGAWWTEKAEDFVLELLDQMAQTYHIDPDRVFLSGMSNGAIGTYLIGLNHIDRFAALMPMAGPLPPPLLGLLDNARSTPFYIIHGSKDQVIPARYSQEVWAYLLEKAIPYSIGNMTAAIPWRGDISFPVRNFLPCWSGSKKSGVNHNRRRL